MISSPLTGSAAVTLLKTFSAADLIRDWQANFQIDITKELHGHSVIELYECDQTKLRFFAPQDIAASGNLYAQLQQFDWYYMPQKWEHRIALQDLANCQTVLEVGCAAGAFIEQGRAAGLTIQGIELNEAAVTIAQQKNLPVERLNLEIAANKYREVLDGVCSFQVLEHVPNPKEFISWMVQMLKPGGQLIYCVPNSESFLQHGHFILDLPPHHVLQWSERSFKALETLFPIRLEKVVREPLASYHVETYLRTYFDYYRKRFPLAKLIGNRVTLPVYRTLLQRGVRQWLTGMSLYVQFRKI